MKNFTKENARRVKVMLEEVIAGQREGLPKWAADAVGLYFSSDSPHLYVDEYPKMIQDLKQIEEHEPWKLERYLETLASYLDHEVIEKECSVCGKTYETFKSDNSICSMACLNVLAH